MVACGGVDSGEITGATTAPDPGPSAPAPAPAPTPAPEPTPAPAQPSGTAPTWIACANEGEVCKFEGTRSVLYGTGERNVTKTGTASVLCNNNTFGDPAFGADKQCWYSSSGAAAPTVPPGGSTPAPAPAPSPAPTPSPSPAPAPAAPANSACVSPNFLGMHWHRDVANYSGAGPTVTSYPFQFGTHRLMSKEGKIRWSAVNPSPGVYDWSDLDKVAARLPAGAKMELVIADPPGHARDTAVWNGSCGPYGWGFCAVKTTSLQDFVRAFLTRYGSKVGSIDPANEWNLASSYGRGTDDQLDGYAAGPVSSLVKAIRDIRAVLTEMGRSDVVLWMGSTTGARQQFSLIDRFPEIKTAATGAQIHCYEQTAANWGKFETTDFCSVMRQGLNSRGLSSWLLSDGEHGISGGSVNEWWNTLVHFASMGWHNVGVYSGDDDGDSGAKRGADPINNPAAAAMYQKFHTEIAGRKIVSIDKSTPMWTVTTESCR